MVVAWLLVASGGALVVGVHDALFGRHLPPRILGTMLVAAGMVFAVGAAGLVSEWRQHRLPALLAGLWGVVLGVLFTAAQLASGDFGPTIAIWVVLAIGSTALVAVVWSWTSADERKGFRRALPILSSVVSVGVIVSVVQFWYSAIYLPAAAPPSLTLDVHLARAGQKHGRIALRGTVTLHNTSGSRVNALTSVVRIVGASGRRGFYGPRSADDGAIPVTSFDGPPVEQLEWNDPTEELLSVARLVPDGTYFQPDETITVPLTVFVPATEFDVVYVTSNIFFARGTLDLDHAPTVPSVRWIGDVRASTRTAPVVQPSWLSDLTRNRRTVRTTWTMDIETGGGTVGVRFAPNDDRLKRAYGYSSAAASAQLSLWPSR